MLELVQDLKTKMDPQWTTTELMREDMVAHGVEELSICGRKAFLELIN